MADRSLRIIRLPDRRDRVERVGEAVEHQNDGGPHEQHVGQGQRAVGRARQALDEADGLVAEIADEAGERRGQAFRQRIDPAGPSQRAQFGQRIARTRHKGLAVEPPVAVDRRFIAAGAEHQIGVEAEQAVAPAHLAALDAFEQEVAAARHHQPPRRAHRRVAVGNDPAPHQCRPAVRQRGGGCGGVFGQAGGRTVGTAAHEAAAPALTARPRAACAPPRSLHHRGWCRAPCASPRRPDGDIPRSGSGRAGGGSVRAGPVRCRSDRC